jgi:serine/threonine protein kinase
MGTVYRARDPRLGRDVALKALPDALASDAGLVARFEREAQILASLNHPHIAALHGLEEVGGSRFLILELVEGDDLSRLIERGPIPLPEALKLARQIADALHAAHEQGIVHRDLKPANVALTRDGRVKVLDFGVAKMVGPDTTDQTVESPTVAATHAGVLIGTTAYMSPEQARGLAIDKRTDIWAFGCVLYEMIAGRHAFPGRTTSDLIARVLEHPPDWNVLPNGLPERVRWLLHRCLEKNPEERLHDIADARIEIDQALRDGPGRAGSTASPSPEGRSRRSEGLAWSVAALCLIGLVGLLLTDRFASDRGPVDPATYTTSIVLPEGVRISEGAPSGRFALSPDGRQLAIVASDTSGRSRMYVRRLSSRAPQPLEGTDGAVHPFWSPDSRFIAFIADNKLKKIDIVGGDVVTICDAQFAATGAWSPDDMILFTPTGNSPIYRVSASSGTPTPVTTLVAESGDVQHSYPFFLPDNRRFLYFVVGDKAGLTIPRGVYVGSLDSKEPGKLILEGTANAMYANGHLIFQRGGVLFVQRFDVNRLELQGEPMSVVEQVQATGFSASVVTGAFSVSQSGLLAYQTGSQVHTQLSWFDRKGTRVGTLGDRADHVDVSLSPDGSRVATSLLDQNVGTRDIWIYDVARGLGERFSFQSGDDIGPNWSRPDGDRIVFSSLRDGSIHLYEKALGSTSNETVLLEDELGKFNARPSSDGQHLIYAAGGGIIARSDIWFLPRFGEQKAAPFLETTFIETQPQFSPDGRWVAYVGNKSGRLEVYVTNFPGRETETRVSTSGGALPRWNRNGKEIFYVAPNRMLTSAAVDGSGAQLKVGATQTLFEIRPRSSRLDAYPYDVTADGQRFIVNTFIDEVMPPITLIINWPGGQSNVSPRTP